MKKIIKKVSRKFGIEITKYVPDFRKAFVSLRPENGCQGNVLLALWIKPFLLRENGDPIPNTHAHNWESLQIAQTFLDLGYCVDVIDYRNSTFIPEKNYVFFVSFRTNFEKIAGLLNEDCVKIAHLDTSHWLFNNSESFKRGLNLQQRKGITLKGLRIVETNMAIEHADCATVLGNQSTIRTYEYALKPIFRVPLSTCAVYPWPGEKDFDSCRKNFLWFGSNGFVHKGLDLVLDVFAEMPDYHLYVCGPIQQEKDFENAYYKELYQSQNIHTVGWVDIESPAFIEVANQCTGIIYPSCAEGQAGSVVTCMHTGLIPIISYESGVDVSSNFGLILEDCSIETIKRSIESISSLPGEQIRQMSRRAWEFARANHTREKFAEEYKKIILNIISKHSKKGNLLDQNLIQRDAFA